MNGRAHRIRRAAAAVALSIGMVGGVIGLAAGTSGAATHTRGNTITAASAPSVPSTGSGHAAGDLTVDLRANGAVPATNYVDLVVSPEVGTVTWGSASVSTTGVNLVTYDWYTNTLWVELPALATGATATINVKGITYTTHTARGTVSVTPIWTTGTTPGTGTYGTFNPISAVNAVAPGAPANIPVARGITATSTPSVGAGATSAVGGWDLYLGGTTAEGWTAGETITVQVRDPAGTNCASSGDYVLFTGTPTATVTASSKVSATPTFSVSSYGDGTCRVNDHNVLTLTFTNSGTFTGTGTFTITVSGVKYAIGATTPTGNVDVTAAIDGGTPSGFTTGATAFATSFSPNARITLVYVTANTPAVTVAVTAYDAPISPVDVVETAPDSVPAGYVCVVLYGPTFYDSFNTSASVTVKVIKGTAAVTSKVTYETTTGSAATTAATAWFARFKITKPSSTTASTFSVSGIAVNASTGGGTGTANVGVWEVAASSNCTGTEIATLGLATAYSIGAHATRVGGATADATAVKQLETVFDASGGYGSCPGVTGTNAKNTRPVVLATTATYQDALASSYLAGYLNTGTLLTPTGALSSVTLQALKTEGITQVDVVGGPLAVSTAVVDTLMTTPAYQCGGTGVLKTGGKTRDLQVTRIWGETQYDTAQKIAQSVPLSHINSITTGGLRLTGAYAGVNATGGNGKYNDTAGAASSAPATGALQKTAFLASGVEFQDAMAASGLAYNRDLPMLLTSPTSLSSQAEAAISNLTITQVIVLGGQLAIDNTVVKTLEGLGVSVLRVGGQNYTDTSVQVAELMVGTFGATGFGYESETTVAVARGNGFTDGIAGAVITGTDRFPLLLTLNQTTVGTHLTAFLVSAGQSGTGIGGYATSRISTLWIFGGAKAITPTVVAKMQTDIS